MMRTLLVALIANGAALAANPVRNAVPLFFIANQGQAPPAVRFMAKGSGLTAYFFPREALFRVAGRSVRMQFEQANPSPRVEGIERLPGHANFLIGARRDWRREVPLYGAVVYRELYPGIDMVYGGEGRDLKSQFVVAPGVDPSCIRIRYAGADGVRLEEDGALAIPVDGRELRERAPSIYQEVSGRRVAVEGRFAVDGDGTVRFLVGDYDVALPLIIDPVLSYSTVLGGSGFNTATALAVDSAGSAYVAGFTESYNFPTANPEQNFNAGGNDVFVAKFNPSGSGLVYCTYVGGSSDDRAYGIAVDGNGFAYVTGMTTSGNFPVRNALQSHLAGGRNAFVLKLSLAGNSLVFSTYLGGNASDNGNGIALDAGGNAYVVGDTTSINFSATGFQKGNHGGQDAFVAKLSADGSRLLYSTYLGGGSDDRGAGIAVDASGSAYITGSTYSTNFPVANAFQSTNGGGEDAFIARLSADGNSLLFSTYLGGTGGIAAYPEAGQGIALDSQGSAYVAGVTSSANFPLLGAVQTSLLGSLDAFVTRVTASGSLVYSTYLGGSGVDIGNAIAVDSGGSAYVVGYTYSTDLPVTASALQTANAGDCDAFLAKLSATGNSLVYLSYLGGNGSDTATAVALNTSGNVYVAGWTLSTNFPLFNPYQSGTSSNYAAFVTKMVLPSSVLSIASSHTGNFTSGQAGVVYMVTVTNQSGALATSGVVTVTDTLPASMTLVAMTGSGWTCVANVCTRRDALAGGSSYPAVTVTVNVSSTASGSATNQVGVSGGGSASANYSDPTTIIGVPVLSITKTADAASVSAGTAIGYTVTVSNSSVAGTGTATSVTLNDPLPAGTGVGWSISPAYSGPGTCSVAGAVGSQTLGCNIGVLAAGASASVHVTSATSTSSCAAYSNTATASAGNSSSVQSSATTTVLCARLSIAKTADAASVSAGTAIGYTVTVSNSSVAGTGTATSVTLNDPLPAGTGVGWSISPAYSGPGTCSVAGAVGSQTLGCNIGVLAAGASASVHVTSATSTSSCAAYSNTATASAGNSSSVQSSATTTVLCASLSITKTHVGSFIQGQNGATYSLTVSNANGAGPTSGTVTVTEKAPTGITLVSMAGTGWTCPSGGATCTRSNPLSAGGSYPAIAVTVNVALTAASPQINSVSVSGGGSGSANATDSTTVTTPLPSFTPICVNAGGGSYTDSLGQVWSADTGYQQGASNSTTASIAGTADPTLYQTERYSTSGILTYQFSVPNGSYAAKLKFAEIWYTSANQRVFGVAINGTTVQSNLDVFAAAGGTNKAYDLSFPVTVSGGQVTITLTAVTGYPKINAIQITQVSATPDFTVASSPSSQSVVAGGSTSYTITTTAVNGFSGTVSFGVSGLPAGATASFSPITVASRGSTTMTVNTGSGTPAGTSSLTVTASSGTLSHSAGASLVVTSSTSAFTPIRVNAGGPAYTDSLGQVWSADTGYQQGTSNSTTAAISGTSDPTLYQTEHYSTTGTLTYQFNVPNGSYTVTLKFAEIWYTSSGQRVFNIQINGTTVQSNLDIFAAAGGTNKAYDLSFPVTVSGGQVTIALGAVVGFEKINAIQIR